MFDIETPDDDMLMKYESASIDFASIDYRGLDRDDNTASLYGLRSEDKKKGHASKLMDYVCDIADMYNINLDLAVGYEKEDENLNSKEERRDMLSHDELMSFYKRKGFVFREGSIRGSRKTIQKDIDCEDSIKRFFENLKEYYLELEEEFS